MISRTLRLLAAGLLATAIMPASEMYRSINYGEMPAKEWAETLGVDPAALEDSFASDGTVQMKLLRSSIPSNVLYKGDKPELEVQIVNLTEAPVKRSFRVITIAYETFTHPGDDVFRQGVRKIAEVGTADGVMEVPANGVQHVMLQPIIPDRNGGYAVMIEMEGVPHRLFITSLARSLQPDVQKRRFYKLVMDADHVDAGTLRRLGVAPNRATLGGPQNPGDTNAEARYQDFAGKLRRWAEAGLPICIEFGSPAWTGEIAPLGRNRPHLDDQGVMKDHVGDIVWMPTYDDHFAAFVKRMLVEYGWPKGPINAVKIWNEPWNGSSISGWGADDERFRELTIAMDKAVREARAEAGVEVLQGGADSSSNSLDKYFSDGGNRFDSMFDFLSIHYQGTDPHTNWRAWRERKDADGKPNPVRFWDTESWVANSEERVAGVLATMFSFGQDRAVGLAAHTSMALGFNRTVLQSNGRPMRDTDGRTLEVSGAHITGVGAAVGAFQTLVGEDRAFSKLLWQGLPFVLQFDGKPTGGVPDPDDGTLVVLGDMSFYNPDGLPLRTVRSRAELDGKRALRAQLAALPANAPERKAIEARLLNPWPYAGCSMTIAAEGDRFSLYDSLGNRLPEVDKKLTVPLDQRGYYLRADGKSGSFAALLAAVKAARIDGYEPLEKKVHDFTGPIANKPTLRLELRNVLNRALSGPLSVSIAGLELAYPKQIELAPHEGKTIEVTVIGGAANAANRYPLELRFDGGDGLVSEHQEEVRVNWISRRTITVDGKLDDWKDAVPQSISINEAATATMTEMAWRPWEARDESIKSGFSIGYLAWDDTNFYFAAKVADTSPHPGTLRFATRNDDDFFYPEMAYQKKAQRKEGDEGGANFSARWSGFLLPTKTGKHTLILNTDDGVSMWLDNKPVINDWTGRAPADSKAVVELTAGQRVPIRIEYFQGGGGSTARFDWIEPGGARQGVPTANLATAADGGQSGLTAEFFDGTSLAGKPKLTRIDATIAYAGWPNVPWYVPAKPSTDKPVIELEELRWPEGVRRYSYRKEPVLPAGNFPNFDNIQLAFNVLPEERKRKISVLPGLIPDYLGYSCTDYEWALNKVSDAYGGGTEVWRLRRPDMPHKHFYPRTLKSPADGPAPDAQLKVVYEGGWRIVEAAIPWSEVPEAKARLDAGQTVKFSYRVNDDQGLGCMELSKRRSVAKRNSSFMVDWVEHWANELEFGAEKPKP